MAQQVREYTYPYQFATFYGTLREQNARYKHNVLDALPKTEQAQKDLDTARIDLDKLGLPTSFRYNVLEKDKERLNIQKTTIRLQRDEIRFRIEPLLEKVLSFFDDIYDDFTKNRLDRASFICYLITYRDLLHTGNSLGLECYSRDPVIIRINEAIERFIN